METNLKIQHTEYPAGREPQVSNTIKDGGLWHSERQDQLLNQARFLVQVPEPKVKRKDEVRDACILFWQVVVVIAVLAFIYFTRII